MSGSKARHSTLKACATSQDDQTLGRARLLLWCSSLRKRHNTQQICDVVVEGDSSSVPWSWVGKKKLEKSTYKLMRLHHHAIVVRDMDSAIRTFCDLLGLKLILRHAGVGEITEVAFVEEPNTGHRMELLAKPNGKSGELDHIAFEVEDVDSEFERLESSGLTTGDEPADVPQGAFLFKKIHSSSCRLAHLFDANDLKIQIVRYD